MSASWTLAPRQASSIAPAIDSRPTCPTPESLPSECLDCHDTHTSQKWEDKPVSYCPSWRGSSSASSSSRTSAPVGSSCSTLSTAPP